MKNLKKILVLCLAAVLLLALTACGGDGTSQTGNDSGKTADVSGTVLLDSEDVKITVSKMDFFEEESQPMLRVNIENNLDQTVWATAKLVSVNSYMDSNPFCVTYRGEARDMMSSWEVPANSNGDNYGLLFNMSELAKAGVTEIGDIELTVFAGKKEFAEDYMGEPVSLHAADVDQAYNEDGAVLVDNEYVKIVALGVTQDEYMGPEVLIYAYGKGDKSFYLNMDNAVVDGTETFGYFGADVAPGKRSVASCAFDGLSEAAEIKELKCSFLAYTMDGEELFTTGEVTVSF